MCKARVREEASEEEILYLMRHTDKVRDDFITFSPDWVSALGRVGGRAARCSCWLAPAFWYERAGWLLTSVPLAVAVLRILRAEVPERGVMTSEKTFAPRPFFDEVASLTPDPPPGGKLIGNSFEWLDVGD